MDVFTHQVMHHVLLSPTYYAHVRRPIHEISVRSPADKVAAVCCYHVLTLYAETTIVGLTGFVKHPFLHSKTSKGFAFMPCLTAGRFLPMLGLLCNAIM